MEAHLSRVHGPLQGVRGCWQRLKSWGDPAGPADEAVPHECWGQELSLMQLCRASKSTAHACACILAHTYITHVHAYSHTLTSHICTYHRAPHRCRHACTVTHNRLHKCPHVHTPTCLYYIYVHMSARTCTQNYTKLHACVFL